MLEQKHALAEAHRAKADLKIAQLELDEMIEALSRSSRASRHRPPSALGALAVGREQRDDSLARYWQSISIAAGAVRDGGSSGSKAAVPPGGDSDGLKANGKPRGCPKGSAEQQPPATASLGGGVLEPQTGAPLIDAAPLAGEAAGNHIVTGTTCGMVVERSTDNKRVIAVSSI